VAPLLIQDEETEAWYKNKRRDFKVSLVNNLKEDNSIIGPKWGFDLWPGFTNHYSVVYLLL